MPNYVIDADARSPQVHDEDSGCPDLPALTGRRKLGWFSSGEVAIYEVRKTFGEAKVCKCAR